MVPKFFNVDHNLLQPVSLVIVLVSHCFILPPLDFSQFLIDKLILLFSNGTIIHHNAASLANARVEGQHDIAFPSVDGQLVDMHLREEILLIFVGPVEQKSKIQAFHVHHYSLLFMDLPTFVFAEL